MPDGGRSSRNASETRGWGSRLRLEPAWVVELAGQGGLSRVSGPLGAAAASPAAEVNPSKERPQRFPPERAAARRR